MLNLGKSIILEVGNRKVLVGEDSGIKDFDKVSKLFPKNGDIVLVIPKEIKDISISYINGFFKCLDEETDNRITFIANDKVQMKISKIRFCL